MKSKKLTEKPELITIGHGLILGLTSDCVNIWSKAGWQKNGDLVTAGHRKFSVFCHPAVVYSIYGSTPPPGRVGELVLKIVFKSLVSRTQSGDHDLEIYKPFIYLVLLLIYLWITLF